ncbi:hypothetical protein [Kutzneria kofuensis]|uniref:Uncharacterized protein n=1 Tax=Kutzneria kofuensis TaxID=103725 RepID=A0A7W9NL52_9PSEU|nr:hypothetical protein [Kutzneria kofuensis]MBB5896076.1 hypothetical protein [Kutzneria kofuensis]
MGQQILIDEPAVTAGEGEFEFSEVLETSEFEISMNADITRFCSGCR